MQGADSNSKYIIQDSWLGKWVYSWMNVGLIPCEDPAVLFWRLVKATKQSSVQDPNFDHDKQYRIVNSKTGHVYCQYTTSYLISCHDKYVNDARYINIFSSIAETIET